jgi:uncharacterized BrkB/YihY/UPF0761 family membrane protein
MKPLGDTAISYGFVMVFVFLGFAGFTLALLSPVLNRLVLAHNDMVGAGGVSVSTANAVNWNVGAFVMVIIVTVIGAVYWVVVRANEQKEYGQG